MPNGDSGGGFDFGGLLDFLLSNLVAFVDAILQFLQALVAAIVQALNFLFVGEQNIFGFSFQSLGEVWQAFKKLADNIFRNIILASISKLYDLYKKLKAWATKLKAWLDRLHALMKKYQMMYFRRVIQLIQRARKILAIFRFFHLKFAQKLDNWLSKIEGKITHYMLLIARKENEVIAWVNFVVDPLGNLKAFPLLTGIISALNLTWVGIFGRPFQGLGGAGSRVGNSAAMPAAAAQTGADAKAGTGQAAELHQRFAGRQTDFGFAAGVD